MHPDQHARTNTAAIKDLFGEILDARSSNQYDESDRVLREAKPDVRRAVEALLAAHSRASGMLLDDTHVGEAPAHTPPQAKSGPAPTSIAGYIIHDEIGHGGFGIVYRAQQRTPIDRAVAAKVLRRELVSEDAITRFRAESALLARMSHDSIAKVYDAGLTDQGQPYVAMELIDGKPLTAACNGLGLGARARVALMASVCDAIQHAHQRAVIHRDLKPANILVEDHPTGPKPRIIDFGIAKLLDDDPNTEHTRASVRLGTPRYMSPEQRHGTETADTRVDVYALGAILCELLAGDVPSSDPSGTSTDPGSFTGSYRITRPSKIAGEQTDTTTIHPRTLRGDLDRIVLKACATDPELRYASAQAMGEDLRRYLDGRPITAAPPGVLYVAKKFVRRHRASVSLAGVLGVALVAALAVAMIQWDQANAERDKAIASADRTAFIGDFLLDMLLLTVDANARGAPPAFTDGTMQSLADRAAEGLDEDPEHMIDMLDGIGRFQAQAGQTEAGAKNVERALAFAIDYYGIPSPKVVELRVHLYDLLNGHGLHGWKDQITLADQESAQIYTDDDPKRMRVTQRADTTIANLERIIAHYEQLDNIDPDDLYHAYQTYTMLLRFGPTPERQLESSARLYQIAREHYPPDNTAVIQAMALHGLAMTVYAPTEESEAFLLDAYERSSRVLGEDHFLTAPIRRGLARIYGILDRPNEGIPYAVADLESVARFDGTDSIQYANGLHELGVLYYVAERFEEARDALEHSLQLRFGQWSEGHEQITTIQVALAEVQLELGNNEDAERLTAEAIAFLTGKRYADYYARAMRVRIAIRERAGDTDGALVIRAQAAEHLSGLGLSPDEIEEMLAL